MNTQIQKYCLPVSACKLLAVAVFIGLTSIAKSDVSAQNRPASARHSAPAKIDVPLLMKETQAQSADDSRRASQEIKRVAAESLIHYELMKGRTRTQNELPLQNIEEEPTPHAAEQAEQDELQQENEKTVERITKIDLKPISEIGLKIRDEAEKRPADLSQDLVGQPMEYQSQSDWAQRLFLWEPANIFYNPLYFQDVTLERYGQKLPPLRQSVLSGARFVDDAIRFPFRALIVRPWTCVSPLGYERPGNCVPFTFEKLVP